MSWEDEERRDALRGRQVPIADCGNGCHDMVRRTGGGGVCFVCGLTVTPDEVA